MLACKLAFVVYAGLEVPVFVVIGRLVVRQRIVAAGNNEEISLVEVRVCHVKAGAVLPGLVLYGLLHGTATLVLLGNIHIGTVAALQTYAEAFGKEVKALGDGHVGTE